MSDLIRSRTLKFILLFALVLTAANCGDESEVIIQDLDCMIEGFEGGSFTFTIDSVSESPSDCILGQSGQFVGERFGPLDLPATDVLPTQETIPNVPLVGTVTVNITTDGNTIRIEGTEPITVPNLPIIGTITATFSGVLCPQSASRVDGRVTVRITSPFSCDVNALATGSI